MQMLPVNLAGLLLIVLALGLFVLEAKYPTHGVLGVGGVISMVLGALFLIRTPWTGMGVSLGTALGVALAVRGDRDRPDAARAAVALVEAGDGQGRAAGGRGRSDRADWRCVGEKVLRPGWCASTASCGAPRRPWVKRFRKARGCACVKWTG